MALTLTKATVPGFTGQGRDAFNKLVQIKEITLTSTYVTGGHAYSVTADFDLRVVELIEFLGPFRNSTNMVIPVWDRTNSKIMFFWPNADAADGPLIEVANATDLSSYVGIVKAIGY